MKERIELQESHCAPHAINLVQVGNGVGTDSTQLAVDGYGTLFFVYTEEVDIGSPREERLEQRGSGDGETHERVGFGPGAEDGLHDGDVAES